MKDEPIALYLVRHAIAAERGETYPDDGKRPLTDRGMKRFRKIASGLAGIGRRGRRHPDQPARARPADRR